MKCEVGGENNSNVIRTTFHPDSDYSTFVGCYKPVTINENSKVYTKEELIDLLKAMKDDKVTYGEQKFAAKYWNSLKTMSRSDYKEILSNVGQPESFIIEINKGIVVGEELAKETNDTEITYKFCPQAFTKAYVSAWKNRKETYYLVIEEINRGNCAQIFGDMFQLLDRKVNGESSYSIKPDSDLEKYLYNEFREIDIEDEEIKSGRKMKLPSNLSIYATMNTSD